MTVIRPKLPTLRAWLLQFHLVIISIEDELMWIDETRKLNKLEKFVILLEDKRYLTHWGFDTRSILREVYKLITTSRSGGASTIEMQLFRTVSNRYERTLGRKLRELFATVVMHRKFSKLQMLRAYLKIAYMGTGLRGVQQAAASCYPELETSHPEFFNFEPQIDFDLLSDLQCAEIASLLVYPKPRLPSANWQTKVARRANYGLTLYAAREKRLDQILR